MEKTINSIANRHIARTLTHLNERFNIEDDLAEGIKVGFRMMQDDIVKLITADKK